MHAAHLTASSIPQCHHGDEKSIAVAVALACIRLPIIVVDVEYLNPQPEPWRRSLSTYITASLWRSFVQRSTLYTPHLFHCLNANSSSPHIDAAPTSPDGFASHRESRSLGSTLLDRKPAPPFGFMLPSSSGFIIHRGG